MGSSERSSQRIAATGLNKDKWIDYVRRLIVQMLGGMRLAASCSLIVCKCRNQKNVNYQLYITSTSNRSRLTRPVFASLGPKRG